MPRSRFLLLAVLAAVLLVSSFPAGAAAQRHFPAVGFGEQRSSVFANPWWQRLGLRRLRYVVGWDALRSRWQTRELDAWMTGARATGARPLIAFTRSRAPRRVRVLPSARAYRRAFRAFRRRYPDVRDFIPWNEVNHCSQPLCHKPQVAASYFDTMRSACPRCTVVAADVLDTPSMTWYLRRFKRHVRHKARIWGLHNYVDANRLRTDGTRTMLRIVRGAIWFTETGGIVSRQTSSPIKFPESVGHAAKATKFVLTRLADLSPRIKRVYLYHFQYQGRAATWDSGVLDRRGRPRVAYRVVARWLARAQAARRARRDR